MPSNQLIYPFESQSVNKLARRWGVKTTELTEAIIQTGSLKKKDLRKYLETKGIIFSFGGLFKKVKKSFVNLADKFKDEEYYS